MHVPSSLPTLSAGSHDASHGQACVMEYVSLLAGEEWSDRPECTHELLAHEARTVNDLLRDSDRSRLVPLIGRLFGTTVDSTDVRAHLRLVQARQVIALIEPDARATALAAVAEAESWLGREGDDDDIAHALSRASSCAGGPGTLDAEHAQFHETSARVLRFVAWDEVGAAEAHALAALSIAHTVAGSGECRADCGNGPARARRMVKDLGLLIDEYDRVTGRVAHDVTPDQIRELADSIGRPPARFIAWRATRRAGRRPATS
ncbi:MAG: hypothetical protein JWP31_2488 [Aeromicrobium sp.]|nr:hypothetical protein [Aeromicrobium sp.]